MILNDYLDMFAPNIYNGYTTVEDQSPSSQERTPNATFLRRAYFPLRWLALVTTPSTPTSSHYGQCFGVMTLIENAMWT